MSIKFDSLTIKLMSMFENITKAKLKDCFIDNNSTQLFVVENGHIAKALGKGGATAKLVTEKFKRKIKIVEFDKDLIKFINNLILPYKVDTVSKGEDIVILKSDDMNTKGLLIGKGGKNLRNYESIVNRYFKIKEIKVE